MINTPEAVTKMIDKDLAEVRALAERGTALDTNTIDLLSRLVRVSLDRAYLLGYNDGAHRMLTELQR